MSAVVIYDSSYGNTKILAEAVFRSIGDSKSQLVKVSDFEAKNLQNFDTVVIGSPTQGGQSTKTVQEFLNNIPAGILNDKKVAVFDTRFEIKEQKYGLRMLMRVIGYAAPKMAKVLHNKGAQVLAIEGFIVNETKGPLKENEIKRAGNWAKSI